MDRYEIQRYNRKLLGDWLKVTPDILLGYRTSTITIENCVYPILVPAPDSMVQGEILRVSKDELDNMDIYEADEYRREKVDLKSGTEVWVYVQ